jgi:GTPase SAR1 family protein
MEKGGGSKNINVLVLGDGELDVAACLFVVASHTPILLYPELQCHSPPVYVLFHAEGVGKSSLISTFISRHFSERIPTLLTRVHLPPDHRLSDCTTTIVDTQDGDLTLQNALSLSSSENNKNNNIKEIAAYGTEPASNESPLSSSTSSSSSLDEKPPSAESLLASTVFRNVDAMVLVYDLTRDETFHRLEDHWLPLIERCYIGNIPVVIAGNKMDLLEQRQQQVPNQSASAARSRQRIISLLQRFKFVRQSLKCSAKNLLHVDDVFNEAKIAVLYPISPLYDLVTGRLTTACSRAFTRIFRIFDVDRDGLLSDDDLKIFQHKIWGVTLSESDVSEWRKALALHDSIIHRRDETAGSVESDFQSEDDFVYNDKITLRGFLTIIDIFISQNRLEVPWTVLWTLGYDDDLNLHIPDYILSSGCDDFDSCNFNPSAWKPNASEIDFLSSMFYQFQSDNEGDVISSEDLDSIFSLFSTPLPPWSVRSKKLLKGCFSLPRVEEDVTPPSSLITGVTFDPEIEENLLADALPSSPSISPSGITISSSPLPSIDVSKNREAIPPVLVNKPMTYSSWMNHWYMFCTISPSRYRAELFSLGYVEGTVNASTTIYQSTLAAVGTQSIFIRTLVLGNSAPAMRSIINTLHGTHHDVAPLTSNHPETTCSVSRILLPNITATSACKDTEIVVHLIVTEIPSSYVLTSVSDKRNLRKQLNALLGKQNADGERVYDMAILVFDTRDDKSWKYVKDTERNLLTTNMPRIFVGTKNQHESSSLCAYRDHCNNMDLEEPIFISVEETKEDSPLLRHLVRCTQEAKFRSIPHGTRSRRLADLKKRALWITSLVSVSMVVLYVFKETKKAERSNWRLFFQRFYFFPSKTK